MSKIMTSEKAGGWGEEGREEREEGGIGEEEHVVYIEVKRE